VLGLAKGSTPTYGFAHPASVRQELARDRGVHAAVVDRNGPSDMVARAAVRKAADHGGTVRRKGSRYRAAADLRASHPLLDFRRTTSGGETSKPAPNSVAAGQFRSLEGSAGLLAESNQQSRDKRLWLR
jgi:hypothetical protein